MAERYAGTGAPGANLEKSARRASGRGEISVGLLRQQLINVLACLVTINLALGAVVIYDRSRQVSTTVSAGAPASNPAPSPSGSPGGAGARSDGILAGGSFSGLQGPSTTGAAVDQPSPTSPALPSTTASPSTRPPAVPGVSTPSRPRSSAPASGRATTTTTAGAAGVATPAPPAPTGTTGQPAADDDSTPPTHAAPPKASTTGSSAPPKATPPSVTTSGVWTVTGDARGDTVIDSSRAPQANDRADMVESRATNTTKAVGLAVKVAQPVDPTRDPIWASAATFVLWEIDTSGDGNPDFEVEYFVEGGKLFAGVSRGNQAACEAEAGYMSESYVVGIDPVCLGSPASLSYRATVFYAADPSNENTDSITDVSPDGGMSTPLRRTAA
jgi:hypothetical protein